MSPAAQQLVWQAQHANVAAAEEQRARREYFSKKTVQSLIATGLVISDSHRETRGIAGATTVSVHERAPRRSKIYQVLPSRWLKLDQHSAHSAQRPSTWSRSSSDPNNNNAVRPATWATQPARDIRSERRSFAANIQHPPSDMLGVKGTNRRERTYVGSICAACEEPLEHTLRGERIVQLACGHVAHEKCFHEFIKELEVQNCPSCDQPLGAGSGRETNIDFDNLHKLARPSPVSETTLTPQDVVSGHFNTLERHQSQGRRMSGGTGATLSLYSESQQSGGRRHDYDVQSVEAPVTDSRRTRRTSMPPPLVTVRSEFPTLTRSRHQQSLTCLVTVEVPDRQWRASATIAQRLRRSSSSKEARPDPPARSRPYSEQSGAVDSVHEDTALSKAHEHLFQCVDDWHGLEFEKFGKLLLHDMIHVGKDLQTWQELECFLFAEMLICVKEKKLPTSNARPIHDWEHGTARTYYTLKGSILVKKHLAQIEALSDSDTLTLHLIVDELPTFHLRFRDSHAATTWQSALENSIHPPPPSSARHSNDVPSSEDAMNAKRLKRASSVPSSHCNGSQGTAPTEYTGSRSRVRGSTLDYSLLHVPIDVVLVVPVTPSMQGLKINLLRDALRFLVSNLGERDRMGLVAFGSSNGATPMVGMTTKNWSGWAKTIDSIRPIGVKNIRADVVDGANIAVDLLMQRRSHTPLSHVVLISDSSTSDHDCLDFVISRAEAAKIAIHSFGLGLTHKPDTMVAMSSKTKASYTYVKDWMMLRECLAGCLGALQSTSHQNVKIRLRLPEGSPARFVNLSGALQVTKRATGRDAEASLGDLRFGDKRDILVQLAIQPDSSTPDPMPVDPWEHMISGLEALSPSEVEEPRTWSVEELPLLQADLAWDDVLRDGMMSQSPQPSLLAITMLPTLSRRSSLEPTTPPIPPHPLVVQRRMELLTSDMLSRALSLVARGQNDRAQHLLSETRSILKGLGKGGLPPLPSPPSAGALPAMPKQVDSTRSSPHESGFPLPPTGSRTLPAPTADLQNPLSPSGGGIDPAILVALDSELEASLEWICHPTVFGRDTRKTVLQAIGVISSQRGFTLRTPSETLWAQRLPGIRRLADLSREWREAGEDEALIEVSEPATSSASFQHYH